MNVKNSTCPSFASSSTPTLPTAIVLSIHPPGETKKLSARLHKQDLERSLFQS